MILVPLLVRPIVLSTSVLMWTYAFQGQRGEVAARILFVVRGYCRSTRNAWQSSRFRGMPVAYSGGYIVR
jgi:hypothetical protein